jgi:hypothetical protein
MGISVKLLSVLFVMHRSGFVSAIAFFVSACYNLSGSRAENADLPSIVFDHPSQDYIFPSHNGGGRIIFAIRAWRSSTQKPVFGENRNYVQEWESWTIMLEVNAEEAGRWPALDVTNTFGEVKVHIEFGTLPAGEHVATCRLVRTVTDDDVDIEHTISFHVGNSSSDAVHSEEDTGKFQLPGNRF